MTYVIAEPCIVEDASLEGTEAVETLVDAYLAEHELPAIPGRATAG